MRRDEAIEKLRSNADRIRALGVRHLFLFGSTARDEATAASDVDLLVEHEPDGFGLMEFAGLKIEMAELLGVETDVSTRQGLHPMLRPVIEAEALQVF